MQRDAIETIFRHAVEAVTPASVIRRGVKAKGDGIVRFGDRDVPVPESGIYVLGLGKASAGMAESLVRILPHEIRGGLIVTKFAPADPIPPLETIEGAHPVPDERSFQAGERLVHFVDAIPHDALVVCLISGGGSAIAEYLRSDVDEESFAQITSTLLQAGADIYELNAVRSRLSEIKGGGLLARLGNRTVVNLIISDVLGDDPRIIASGPTVPAAPGESADEVLERYGVEVTMPDPVDSQTPSEPLTLILGNLDAALGAAAETAENLGYTSFRISSRLDGEASYVARTIATVARDARDGLTDIGSGFCLLAGGETTVQVRGTGRGGRNTECALSAAIRLGGSTGVTMGFLATDGDDGDTGAAGGIVDGATIPPDRLIEARKALQNNDSYTFLETYGATYAPGPTGTNVNDLIIGLLND